MFLLQKYSIGAKATPNSEISFWIKCTKAANQPLVSLRPVPS